MPMPRAQSAGTAPIDPARTKLVDAARTAWIGRLIDLSRRNNLLFYRPIPTSSIDLSTQRSHESRVNNFLKVQKTVR
jgi:hypothetical protein